MNWEKKFNIFIDNLPKRVSETPRNVLKEFIAKLLDKHSRKMYEKGRKDMARDLREQIEKKKYDSKAKHRSMFFHRTRWCPKCEADGYNYAIDDIINSIKEQ